MNYIKHYENLIIRAKNRILAEPKEAHHIIPKCLGGNNYPDNLVDLTLEEHFVAHQLLVKIYPGSRKLIFALSAMTMSINTSSRNNKMYAWIKKKNIEARTGLQKSKETKSKISKSLTGRKTSSGMLGNIHREESKIRIAKQQTGKMKNSVRNIYAWFKSPTQEIILFGPLLYECRIFNLNRDYIKELITTNKKSYKGWEFIGLATQREKEVKIAFLKSEGLMI